MHFLPITSCHRRFFNITVFGAKSEYLEQIPSRLNLFVLTFGIHVHYQFSSIDFRKDSITMRHKDLVSRCHHLFEVFLIFHIRTKYTSILYTVSSYFSLLKVLGHYGCLRTLFQAKLAGMKKPFFAIFDPTWTHVLTP